MSFIQAIKNLRLYAAYPFDQLMIRTKSSHPKMAEIMPYFSEDLNHLRKEIGILSQRCQGLEYIIQEFFSTKVDEDKEGEDG